MTLGGAARNNHEVSDSGFACYVEYDNVLGFHIFQRVLHQFDHLFSLHRSLFDGYGITVQLVLLDVLPDRVWQQITWGFSRRDQRPYLGR